MHEAIQKVVKCRGTMSRALVHLANNVLYLDSGIRLGFCVYRFCHTRIPLSGIHGG